MQRVKLVHQVKITWLIASNFLSLHCVKLPAHVRFPFFTWLVEVLTFREHALKLFDFSSVESKRLTPIVEFTASKEHPIHPDYFRRVKIAFLIETGASAENVTHIDANVGFMVWFHNQLILCRLGGASCAIIVGNAI